MSQYVNLNCLVTFQINTLPHFQIKINYGRSNYNAASFRYNDGR